MPRCRRGGRDDDAVDELIRRRVRACETLPLFPDRPRSMPRGFFEPSDIGPQLRLLLTLAQQKRPGHRGVEDNG